MVAAYPCCTVLSACCACCFLILLRKVVCLGWRRSLPSGWKSWYWRTGEHLLYLLSEAWELDTFLHFQWTQLCGYFYALGKITIINLLPRCNYGHRSFYLELEYTYIWIVEDLICLLVNVLLVLTLGSSALSQGMTLNYPQGRRKCRQGESP